MKINSVRGDLTDVSAEKEGLIVMHSAVQMPTQDFITNGLGMPLYMEPNFEDLSCKMIFGQLPPALEDDPVMKENCFTSCALSTSEYRYRMYQLVVSVTTCRLLCYCSTLKCMFSGTKCPINSLLLCETIFTSVYHNCLFPRRFVASGGPTVRNT